MLSSPLWDGLKCTDTLTTWGGYGGSSAAANAEPLLLLLLLLQVFAAASRNCMYAGFLELRREEWPEPLVKAAAKREDVCVVSLRFNPRKP